MIPFLAALSLLLGTAAAPVHAPFACTQPGKARWGAKSNIPKASSIARAKRVALKDLMTLEDPDPVPKRGQPATGLITGVAANGQRVHEGQILRTRGWLRLVATEDNDCEYHMQLTLTRSSTRSFIVEVAKDDTASIHSVFVRGKAKEVRAWIRDELFEGREPPEGGRVISPPVFVDIVGQLFFDSAHGEHDARGKAGMPAATRWELHPVLTISGATPP
jgi:hypothetical protein